MPGAEALERRDDGAYKVAIRVKLGPVTMTSRDSKAIVESGTEGGRAIVRARAREARGHGAADAKVLMRLAQSARMTRGRRAALTRRRGELDAHLLSWESAQRQARAATVARPSGTAGGAGEDGAAGAPVPRPARPPR